MGRLPKGGIQFPVNRIRESPRRQEQVGGRGRVLIAQILEGGNVGKVNLPPAGIPLTSSGPTRMTEPQPPIQEGFIPWTMRESARQSGGEEFPAFRSKAAPAK